jgi:hypothetical protein
MTEFLTKHKTFFTEEDYIKEFIQERYKYAYTFLKLLRRYTFPVMNDLGLIVDNSRKINQTNKNNIMSLKHHSFPVFKRFICEIIYNALNEIGETIDEYTIITKNSGGTVQINIGITEFIDEDIRKLSIFRIKTDDFTFSLSNEDIEQIYIANRTVAYDYIIVNSFITYLYLDGNDEPTVKTSYKPIKKNSKW